MLSFWLMLALALALGACVNLAELAVRRWSAATTYCCFATLFIASSTPTRRQGDRRDISSRRFASPDAPAQQASCVAGGRGVACCAPPPQQAKAILYVREENRCILSLEKRSVSALTPTP